MMDDVTSETGPNLSTADTVSAVATVDLFYPRSNTTQAVRIELVDVRAANAITVAYDFDRDGWSIRSTFEQPEDEAPETEGEVAFIPAWPKRNTPE